jgi:hypothetical protein
MAQENVEGMSDRAIFSTFADEHLPPLIRTRVQASNAFADNLKRVLETRGANLEGGSVVLERRVAIAANVGLLLLEGVYGSEVGEQIRALLPPMPNPSGEVHGQ